MITPGYAPTEQDLNDSIKKQKLEKAVKAAFERQKPKNPLAIDLSKPSILGQESADIANAGKVSKTQVKQDDPFTPEGFMAAWDTLNPKYKAPTGNAGAAALDPLRQQVREAVVLAATKGTGGKLDPAVAKKLMAQSVVTLLGPPKNMAVLNDPRIPEQYKISLGESFASAPSEAATGVLETTGALGEVLGTGVRQILGQMQNAIHLVMGIPDATPGLSPQEAADRFFPLDNPSNPVGPFVKGAAKAVPYTIPGLGQAAWGAQLFEFGNALANGTPVEEAAHDFNPLTAFQGLKPGQDPEKWGEAVGAGLMFGHMALHGYKKIKGKFAVKPIDLNKPEDVGAALAGLEKYSPESVPAVEHGMTEVFGPEDAAAKLALARAAWSAQEQGRTYGEGVRGKRDLPKEGTDPNAVQEQSANEGVLRQEEPGLGLQEVGPGNAGPEITAEGPKPEGPKPEAAQTPETQPAEGGPEAAQTPETTVAPKAQEAVETVWHSPDGDIPIKVTGYKGYKDGRHYLSIEGSDTGVPMDEVIASTPEQAREWHGTKPVTGTQPMDATMEAQPAEAAPEPRTGAEPTAPTENTQPVPEAPQTGAQGPETASLEPTGDPKAKLSALWDEIKAGLGTAPEQLGALPHFSEAQIRAIGRLPELAKAFYEAYGPDLKAWLQDVGDNLGDWAKDAAEKVWIGLYGVSTEKTPEARVFHALDKAGYYDALDFETGLSNYVQGNEAALGIIAEVFPTNGQTAEYWKEYGRQAVSDPSNPIDFRKLAEDIATGKSPLSPENIAVLTAGKGKMLSIIQDLKTGLDGHNGNKYLAEQLDYARNELDLYLKQIQIGKGRWSDVGRALQIGLDIDWSNFEEVIAEAKRRSPGGKVSRTDTAKLKTATDKIAELKAGETKKSQELRDDVAKDTIKRVTTGKSGRKFVKAEINKEIADAVAQLKKLRGGGMRPPGGQNPKTTGARTKITAKDLARLDDQRALVKKIAFGYAKLYIGAPLESIVIGVQNLFRSQLNTDIERQAVIDAIATPGNRGTRTELQKHLSDVRAQARSESTVAKAEADLKERLRFIAYEDARIKREFIGAEQKRLRAALAQDKQAVMDAWNEVKKTKKAEWNDVQEQQRAHERAQRIEAMSARKEYIDWWNLQEKQRRYNESSDYKKAKAEYDKQQKEQKRGQTKPAEDGITEDRLKQIRAKQAEKAEPSDKAKSDKAYRDWWNAQAAILEAKQRLNDGDFAQPTKKQSDTAQDILDIRAERAIWTQRVKRNVQEQSTPWGTRAASQVAGFVRQVFLGGDLGVLLRQGKYGVARPKAFLNAVRDAVEAGLSETNYKKFDDALNKKRARDGSLLLIKRNEAGLSLTDRLSHPEEFIALRALSLLGEKISAASPKGSFRDHLGNLPGALERFQSAFINSLRTREFDAAYEAGYTPEELRLRAKFINNATGRGNIDRVPVYLQAIFTSPRYELSRWGMLGEPLRAGKYIIKDLVTLRKFNKAAYANLQDLVVTAGLTIGLFKAAEYAGYQVNWDPDSADFLKMRRGDEVWDTTAGIAPRLRDAMRVRVRTEEPSFVKNLWGLVTNSGRRALSPAVTIPIVQISLAVQRAKNEEEGHPSKVPVNPLTGYKLGEYDEEGTAAYIPMIYQATLQSQEKEGTGAWAFTREFLGESVNRYPYRVPK